MAIITVYDLLEVSENASKEEIEESYSKLINEYKTDSNYPEEVNNENKIILEKLKLAYNILMDDEKRKKYDAELTRKRAEELIKNVTLTPVEPENVNESAEKKIPDNKNIQDNQIKYKKTNKEVEDEEEKYKEEYEEEAEEDTAEIKLTASEKKRLKKAAEREFKNNLKKAQKAEEEYNRAYNQAYNNYLKKMGYTVKEPWSLKRIKNIIIRFFVIVFICILIWLLPPTRNLLIQIYEENFIVKSIVDITVMLFNVIMSVFE